MTKGPKQCALCRRPHAPKPKAHILSRTVASQELRRAKYTTTAPHSHIGAALKAVVAVVLAVRGDVTPHGVVAMLNVIDFVHTALYRSFRQQHGQSLVGLFLEHYGAGSKRATHAIGSENVYERILDQFEMVNPLSRQRCTVLSQSGNGQLLLESIDPTQGRGATKLRQGCG